MDENTAFPSPGDVPPEIFLQAVEQSALAISITDANAHILYANPAFQRVTGYARADVVGRNESILSYKVTPRLVYESMWAQLMRRKPWNGLLVNRRRDGSRYIAELTISPVLDAAGQTTHYLGMHRDVTEMHRLERELQNKKALIESVVDAAQVAIAVLDEQEAIVLRNREYERLQAALGEAPSTALPEPLRAGMGAAFAQASADRQGFAGHEMKAALSDGQACWLSCSGTWIEEQDTSADAFYEPNRHRYLLLTFQDISALKAQQESIRVNGLHALLAEQERIQSLREALAGAVYQLEGPFNMLAAAVRMLERRHEHAAGDPLTASLQEALDAGGRTLASLRASIPDAIAEAPVTVDLNELIRDVLRLSTPRMLADGIVVEWTPATQLPDIQGQPRQLASLFKQLVDNAVEAIHDARGQRRELKVATTAHADRIEVAIEDSGPGIPEALRLKVFEPFFTTKGANRQHIGMGLTMVQEALAGHHGLIEIADGAAGGCLVRVQLPIA